MNFLILLFSCLLMVRAAHGTSPPPLQDPFYRKPTIEEQSRPPGSILDYRPSPNSYIQPLPEFIHYSFQILYRTTDSFGNPTAAVATVFVPWNPQYDKIFMSNGIENSASPNCAPSYTLASTETDYGFFEYALHVVHACIISGALNQGWIVTVPDYEGLGGAFMANLQGAFIGLDSVRATLSSASQGLTEVSPDASVAIMGYSGGSSPALLAVELHDLYAPELNIVAAAAGGLTPFLEEVMDNLMPASSLILVALTGLANEYPALTQLVEQHLVHNTTKRKEFEEVGNHCFGWLRDNYGTKKLGDYFDTLSIINSSVVRDIFRHNNLGKVAPNMPLLIYESENDEITPTTGTDRLVNWYCASGTEVDYRKDKIEKHGALGVDGWLLALHWVKHRLDGIPTLGVCRNSTFISALLDPGTLLFLPDSVLGLLDRVAGTDLGLLL